jgi:ACS family glucarate transporter-like MFS transporter
MMRLNFCLPLPRAALTLEPMGDPSASSGPADEKPTRVRFGVLVYLCLLALVLYLDRVCISQAGPVIRDELKLSEKELGYLFASFTIAYGLFMAAAGRLGDRFGSRGVLVAIVIWWSAFTALTGLCYGFWMLLVVRFVFGAGEAGAFPNCARVISRWFPPESRGFPQGLLNTAALVGGAVAPFAVAHLMDLFDRELAPTFHAHFGSAPVGWRWTFFFVGLLGVGWALLFWRTYRDDPEADPRVNEAERALIRGSATAAAPMPQPPVPWHLVLRSRNLWLMGFIIICASFSSYLYMFWLPTYLQSGRGADKVRSGELASVVLAAGAVGSLLGGLVSDRVMRRTGRRRTRSWIGAAAMLASAAALFGSLACEDVTAAALVIALAFFLMQLMIASWWGAVSDISGRHVATLFGLMNSMGVIGGAAAQIFFGWMADVKKSQGLSGRAQWDPALVYFVAALAAGAIAWLFVDSNRSAVDGEI